MRIISSSIILSRSVLLIDSICQKINGKLHRLAALVPDVASLPSLDYDTSKRANPEVLHKLVDHAKVLRVCQAVV